jgi:hypothetical protein
MNRTGRRAEVAVSLAVVAVFAALWVLEFGVGAPPEPGYVASVVVVTDARMLFDGELGERIGGNLDGFIWVLVGIPLLGLPFGVIGAALGARPRRRRARELPEPGPQPDGHTILR